MLKIQITIKTVYGEDRVYPANQAAHCIAAIAGTKTLTRAALYQVLSMGATIEEVDRYGNVSRTFRAGEVCANLPGVR